MQGMVTRAELLSAQSEVKACKDAAAAKAEEFALMESQVSKGLVELQAALLEVAQVQSAISAMVPRSELEAAKQQLDLKDSAMRAEGEAQVDLVFSLNERVKALEEVMCRLHTRMEVR